MVLVHHLSGLKVDDCDFWVGHHKFFVEIVKYLRVTGRCQARVLVTPCQVIVDQEASLIFLADLYHNVLAF